MPDEPKRPPTAAPPRRLARLWRWTWRGALGLTSLVALTVAGALVFVESDAGRDLARESAAEHGLSLDYDRLELSPFSGEAKLGALRLPMPERCRVHGEDWLRVERVDLGWDAGEALAGRLSDVRVIVEGVDLVYAIDAQGTDCVQQALLSLLGDDAPTEPMPLSGSLAALTIPPELAGIEVASLEIRDVRARFVDVPNGLSVEVEGPTLRGHAREEAGVLRGELVLGSADEGLRVRANESDAQLVMEHRIVLGGASGNEITLASSTTLHALILEAPLVDVDALRLPRELLGLDATARFEPEVARTSVQVTRLAVLDEVATGQGGVAIPDEARIRIAPSSIEVDLGSLAAAIPELVDLAFDDVRATARVTPAEGAEEVRFELDVRAGRLALPEERAVIERATIAGRGTWRGDQVSFEVDARADAVATRGTDVALTGRAVVLEADATGLAVDGTRGAANATLTLAEISVGVGDLRASVARPSLVLEAPSVRAPRATLTAGAVDMRAGAIRAELPSVALHAAAHELDPRFAVPVTFEGSVRTVSAEIDADGLRLTPQKLGITFDGVARTPTELDVRTRTRVAALEARQDALTAQVDGFDLRFALSELVLAEAGPRGTVVVDGRTRRVDLRDAIQHVVIDGLGLSSRVPIAGGAPARLTGRIPLGNVRYATADREPTPIVERGEVAWALSELRLDPVLARSRARLSGELQLWPVAGAEPVETAEELAAREQRRAERRARLIAEAEARGEAPPIFEDRPRERTLRAGVRAQFDRGAGELDVELRGRTVAMLGPLLGMDELALERARARMNLHGTYARLDRPDPSIVHRGELRLRRIGLRGEGGAPLVFPRVVATLDHSARAAIHDATLRIDIEPPTLGEETLPHGVTLVTSARVDLNALSMHSETRSENAGDMSFELEVDANLDSSGTLVHRERLLAEGLHGLEPWLPPELPVRVDSAQVHGEGRVFHAIEAAAPSFEQTVRVAASALRYRERGGILVRVPKVVVSSTVRGDERSFRGDAELEVTNIDVVDGLHRVTVTDTRQALRFDSEGSPEDRRVRLHTEGSIGLVEQDFVPAYPMEAITLVGDAATDRRSFRVERLVLANERGGTRLELSQEVERIGLDREEALARQAAERARRAATPVTPEEQARQERRAQRRAERAAREAAEGRRPPPSVEPATPLRVTMRGRLQQDLARLDGAPSALAGSGRIDVPFTVESGDGSLFRMHARAEVADVDLSLPGMAIELRGARARVPIEEAFLLSRDGFRVVVNTERSPFARVRHLDTIAPEDDAFVELDAIRVGEVEVGPLTGRLRLDRNVFALDDVRLNHREALITGQVLVDYVPGRESVTFRGNITGLRTRTSRSPLDANAAVVFTPSRLELDGRVQIVRVATAHLRGLLDLLDPYREDPSLNSLRGVLRFAHPNQVTLDLSQGLMSLEVALGGIIGRFLDVSAIRGIPLGPLMNRHVAPLVGRDE